MCECVRVCVRVRKAVTIKSDNPLHSPTKTPTRKRETYPRPDITRKEIRHRHAKEDSAEALDPERRFRRYAVDICSSMSQTLRQKCKAVQGVM
jgi:hypothetical protein